MLALESQAGVGADGWRQPHALAHEEGQHDEPRRVAVDDDVVGRAGRTVRAEHEEVFWNSGKP